MNFCHKTSKRQMSVSERKLSKSLFVRLNARFPLNMHLLYQVILFFKNSFFSQTFAVNGNKTCQTRTLCHRHNIGNQFKRHSAVSADHYCLFGLSAAKSAKRSAKSFSESSSSLKYIKSRSLLRTTEIIYFSTLE